MRIRAKIIVKNYELEERRIKLGLTQAEFADIIGIQVARYGQIEQMKIIPREEEAKNIGYIVSDGGAIVSGSQFDYKNCPSIGECCNKSEATHWTIIEMPKRNDHEVD